MKSGESDRRHHRGGARRKGAGQHVWCVALAVSVWTGSSGAWASPGAGVLGPGVLDGTSPTPSAEVVGFGAAGHGVEFGEGFGGEEYGAGGGAVGVPGAGPAVAPVPVAAVGGLGLLAAMAVRRRRRQRDWSVESLF